MNNNKKIVVVMPAYNAEETLRRTYDEIPHDIVDEVILVDDASTDQTAIVAKAVGIKHVVVHDKNLGYGANQKTCYREALALDADIVIMLHPDYQYTPRLIRAMVSLLVEDVFDCVLGSRILGVGALEGGMPLYKYVANRALTFFQNIMVNHKLSEYHTGYRAFSRDILETLPLDKNSDDFIFDNQMLLQVISRNYRVGEVSCPTAYFEEASSIGGLSAIRYGLGVLRESFLYRLDKMKVTRSRYANH